MRTYALILALLILGCTSEISPETKAVDVCDLEVIENLAVPESYDGAIWQVSESGGFVTVDRPFESENSFGIRLKERYTCVVRDGGEKIAFLQVYGPIGASTIVDDGTAPTSPKRIEQIEAGAERIARIDPSNSDPRSSGNEETEWVANLTFSGCPEASDWFDMQQRVRAGDYSAELPSRCFRISPGDRIVAKGHSQRETVNHNGHTYEQARTNDGRVFWSDSLDEISLSPIN